MLANCSHGSYVATPTHCLGFCTVRIKWMPQGLYSLQIRLVLYRKSFLTSILKLAGELGRMSFAFLVIFEAMKETHGNTMGKGTILKISALI